MSKQRKETRNLYKFMHNIADGEKIAIMDKMLKSILDDYGIFPDPKRDRNGVWRLFSTFILIP